MPAQPTGTVTFLFTDIEGSTKRWERIPAEMAVAVARHDALMRGAIEQVEGYVFKTVGDAFCAAFQTPEAGLRAALDAQRALGAEDWTAVDGIRVRMALHTGQAEERDADYFGPTVNRVARLLSAGHGGQVLLSAAARDALVGLPPDVDLRDLGERRLKDLTQPEQIFQLLAPDLDDAFAPLATLDARPNNLPAQPTPLLGRDAELAAVKERLRKSGTRLVTITGPGGTGKTRLALQVAADVIDDYAHGVWFVDLGAVTDPALVPAEIANALGVREEGGGSLEAQVIEHLREQALLLVLDNMEQVLSAGKFVAKLTGACPKLHLLVTSRARLRISGEQEYAVPPLGLPNLRRLPTPDHLLAYPAVELFVQRAEATKHDFALTAENAPAVAEICVALDGLPLAIELAAARVKLLPPQAMLGKLESRLKLLTGGARDKAERQQTLRGAIAWSYDLLPEGERLLLARLSVFAGGATFEAAEAVCNPDGDLDLFEGLDALVEHSLIRQEETDAGEPRFRMLATIREFAGERLDESGDTETFRQLHAEHFRALAEEAKLQLVGKDQAAWLDRLETEHDNLRAAITWSLDAARHEDTLRLAGSLWRFWYVRGHLTEGRTWLGRVLAENGGHAPAVVADALDGAGMLARAQGDVDAARASLMESLERRRASGNGAKTAETLVMLGNVTHHQSDFARAAGYFDEAATLARAAGEKRTLANALSYLGDGAMSQGNIERATELLTEGVSLFRSIGDLRGESINLSTLGTLAVYRSDFSAGAGYFEQSLKIVRALNDLPSIAIMQINLADALRHIDDVDGAQALCAEALQIARELSSKDIAALSLNVLGRLSLDRGELDLAREQLHESLELSLQAGDQQLTADCLEALGSLAAARHAAEDAARMFGSAEAIREAIGAPLQVAYLPEYERAVREARAQIDADLFAEAWAAGRATPPETYASLVLR